MRISTVATMFGIALLFHTVPGLGAETAPAPVGGGLLLDINMEAILTALTLLGGAFAWLYQIRTKSRRDKIKLDL